jgi:hypothetical protein
VFGQMGKPLGGEMGFAQRWAKFVILPCMYILTIGKVTLSMTTFRKTKKKDECRYTESYVRGYIYCHAECR